MPKANSDGAPAGTVQVAGVAWAMDRGVSQGRGPGRRRRRGASPRRSSRAHSGPRRGSSGATTGPRRRAATASRPRDRRRRRGPGGARDPARARRRPRLPLDRPRRRSARRRAALPVPSMPMPRRRYLFETPDRFVAGTVGRAGQPHASSSRPATGHGSCRSPLEKVQVAVLAQRLGDLLDELERRGIEGAEDEPERRRRRDARSTSRSTRRSGSASCRSAGTPRTS